MDDQEIIPVAIVGGGPCGLTTSMLLSSMGVRNVVFERYPDTSIHPKAVGLNQRTMEIFRAVGIEDEIRKARAPNDIVGRTAWFTNLGPEAVELENRTSWGNGSKMEEYITASPTQYSFLAQIRLEPIMKRRVLELDPNAMKYGTEVLKIVEHEGHVEIQTKALNGVQSTSKAKYVLAADGGRSAADNLGFKWHGESDVLQMATAHFRSNLTAMHPDPRVFLTWLVNPKLGGSSGGGYVYHIGPYDEQLVSREWVFAAPKFQDDPSHFDNNAMTQRIKRSLELPDLDVEVLSISHWSVHAKVTDRYRTKGGRIFLLGDACHRVPPWGALGVNTGAQDAYNLAWRIALAVSESDSSRYERLLSTYELERKPIAERVAAHCITSMRMHKSNIDAAVGITRETSTEENLAAVEAFRDPSHPDHHKKRDAVAHASYVLDNEFHAPGLEIGWFYPSMDLDNEGEKSRHDGQLLEDESLDFRKYHPSTIPGHHVPHAWLEKDGKKVSTRDLVHLTKFVLFVNAPIEAPIACKDLENEFLKVEVIGKTGWTDADNRWAAVCGVGADGAVLVRPDAMVLWRTQHWSEQSVEQVQDALTKCLQGVTNEASSTAKSCK